MHGIHAVLDGFHIKHDNIPVAIQAVKNLGLSINVVNTLISESIDREPDGSEAEVEHIADLAQARTVLTLMVQTGLRNKVQKFSLDALEEFKKRALTVVQFEQPVIMTQKPVDNKPPTVVAIERAPVVNVAVVSTVKAKGTRNRKVNPNSNLSRAKALYADAADKSRDAIVALYVKELGIESGTATTYYYLAKKG